MKVTCYDCNNGYNKHYYGSCPYCLSTTTVESYMNSLKTANSAVSKYLEELKKEADMYDAHKYTRRQNRECGGQTDFDMVIGEGVYGTRSWNIDKYGRLKSPTKRHTWKPGENVSDGHGFYSYTDKPTFEGSVKGIIRGFGKVTYGTRGFIAEKAEIVALLDKRSGLHTRLKTLSYKAFDNMGGDKNSFAAIGLFMLAAILLFGSAVLSPGVVFFAPVLAKVLAGLGSAIGLVVAFYAVVACVSTPSKRERFLGSAKYPLRKLYPDVKFFTSEKKMLKAFGLPNNYEAPLPDPSSDEFWKM